MQFKSKQEISTAMCVSSFGSLPGPNSDLKLTLGITFLLSIAIGLLGNIVAIVIVAKVLRSRQTVPNVLILLLACIDLFTIIFSFVPALLNYFSGLHIAHAPLCNFQGFSLNFLYLMSITLVSCLSFDRFLALYTPFFYKAHAVFNCKKLAVILTLLCCIAMVISLLPSLGLGQHVLQYPGTFCMFQLNPTDLGGKITLNTNLSFLLACMIIVVACNSAVSWKSFKMLKRSREQRPSMNLEETGSSLSICSTNECQFLKLSVIVMTSFLCCWTVLMVRVIMIQSGSPFNSCWDMIAFRLVTLHTLCNPWIYLLTRRQYRKAFWYIIKMSAFFFTCKKLCRTEGNFGDTLGLRATKVQSENVQKKTDSKENLLRSKSGSVNKT